MGNPHGRVARHYCGLWSDEQGRLSPALGLALIAPDIGGPWRIRGVRLVATDLHFAVGAGAEVRGPAEALLMAIAGRRGVAGELSGPGQRKLAERAGG